MTEVVNGSQVVRFTMCARSGPRRAAAVMLLHCLPTDCCSILAMVGAGAIDRQCPRCRRTLDIDRLIAADPAARGRGQLMAHRGERRPHRGVELGLERQLVRDLAMMKTRYVGRHLEVGAEIEDVDTRRGGALP